MSKKTVSRRDFLRFSAMGASTIAVSSALTGCGGGSSSANQVVSEAQADVDNAVDQVTSIPVSFKHGVASGDPSHSAVILWTRVTLDDSVELLDPEIEVSWQISTVSDFSQLIASGNTTTSSNQDYTVKVDAIDLNPGQGYFYRFASAGETSEVGFAKTLPLGSVEKVSLAVVSCANYPAGYFHVYEEVAKRTDIDAVLHLGDYLYEYGSDGYASGDAAAMGRVVEPVHEIVSLDDYRRRYRQYRSDVQLQAAHASHSFISVWDDHEIANNTWREGAENHNDGEGDFSARKLAALQAYFEWMPIRPMTESDSQEAIYRNFEFGSLVNLSMLDTRIIGRDQPLDFLNYFDSTSGAFDSDRFATDLADPTRKLLGADQLLWLQGQLTTNTATWQVLGQQILMAKIYLPGAIATQQMSVAQYAELGALAQLAARANAGDPTLTAEEIAYLTANADRLTDEVIALLQLPAGPYNLDAWDGYAYEREQVLGAAAAANANLVVLAGDTHNAWANNLTNQSNQAIGVEFATSSVSSPGLEEYLSLTPETIPATEAGLVDLVTDMEYLNVSDRGFMTVTFTAASVKSHWHYVSTVKSQAYALVPSREKSIEVTLGTNKLPS